jgi:hypothetical protein
LSDTVGGYEKSKMWILGITAHSFWLTQFMEGLHKHVGEVWHQDEPITIEVLHELDCILEEEWLRNNRLLKWVLGLLLDFVQD